MTEQKASKGSRYRPRVTFDYTYEGGSYTSTNVYPGELPREFGNEDEARAQLADDGPGDTVTAYVPPDSPGEAFLKHTTTGKPFLAIGAAS
ncbi:DUF3592 domain-containing protein [Halorussus marinus]|uniref:DUF3592 domain-containing protein n=1 Tax=Halorussus marinus TaxID=2505976 RepID=UPI001FCEC8AF